MRDIAIWIAAVVSAELWVGVIGPATLRILRIPAAIGVWRLDRGNQHLTKLQYIWGVGAFAWGLGLSLFATVYDYLSWAMLGDPSSRHRLGQIAIRSVVFVLLGALFGVMTVPGNRAEEK